MSVTQEGKLCFYRDKRDKKAIDRLRGIHSSIRNYVRDMADFFPGIAGCTASVKMYDSILGLLSEEGSEFDEEIFHMNNEDEFMGRVVTSMNR